MKSDPSKLLAQYIDMHANLLLELVDTQILLRETEDARDQAVEALEALTSTEAETPAGEGGGPDEP